MCGFGFGAGQRFVPLVQRRDHRHRNLRVWLVWYPQVGLWQYRSLGDDCIAGMYPYATFSFSICSHKIPRAIVAEYVCSAQTIGTAVFPATNSLVTATGTCVSGYGGSPKSTCSASGTWGTVTSPCVGTPRVRMVYLC